MAGDLDIRINDRAFQRALSDLAAATQRSYPEVIKANARLIAVNLAYQTQPFGDDSSAKEKGEAAVRRDIGRVFADAPATYRTLRDGDRAEAGAFYRAMLQKDWPEAQRILAASGSRWRNVEVSPFDERLHKKSRNNRGRVNRHVPAQIVSTGAGKMDTYTKKKVRMVGFAKAGWAAAAARLSGNTRGIPQFVTRHKNAAPGTAVDRTSNVDRPHVSLGNDVRYVRSVCSAQQINAALEMQRQKMLAHIRRVLDAAARRFNR